MFAGNRYPVGLKRAAESLMKITDLRVYLTRAGTGRTWVFVEVDTDEGITGVGESTNSGGGGAIMLGHAYELIRADLSYFDFSEGLIGQDPSHINRIWHMIYRRFGTLGSRGFATTLCSGIDMALWDIKGKALGKPVYDLLGGPMRDSILLYSHVAPTDDIPKAVEDAKRQVALGYTALKLDPFGRFMGRKHRRYIDGKIPAEGATFGVELMAALREAVGPDIELMIDAHGNFDVPTAIDLCNRMLPYHLTWFEEPLQPESVEGLRQVRANTDIPLCTGERKYTRWDFVPILQEGLVNYIMPDICWTGGISEMVKIAVLAESYYVPISPHDASGPFNVVAGAHAMMGVPNFYRLEMTDHAVESYNAVLTEPLDIRDGCIHLPETPGLGYELDHDFIQAHPDPDWERIKGR